MFLRCYYFNDFITALLKSPLNEEFKKCTSVSKGIVLWKP